MAGRWWAVAQIAAELGVSKMTIYRLIHAGEIEAVKVGKSYRVADDKFKQYLKRSKVSGDGGTRD